MRRTSSMGLSFPPFTRAVKQLLIANGVVYLVVALLGVFVAGGERWMQIHFGLVPALVVFRVWIWQLVTYAFLHDGLLHIFFNMLALWMFGAQLEQDWGYNIFMQFYFFCAVGAALTTVAVSFTGILGADPRIPTVGASGAIFGLLLAFGILYSESEIMLFPLPFLIKAKYFIIGLIFIEVCLMLSAARQPGESVAYMAHMGGLLFGYIWLKFVPRRGSADATSERAFPDRAIPTIAGNGNVRRASSKFICANMTIAGIISTRIISTSTEISAIPARGTSLRGMAIRGLLG